MFKFDLSRIPLDLNFKNIDAFTICASCVIGAGLAFGIYRIVSKYLDEQPPKKWREVGILDSTFCFPIKSCAPILLEETCATQNGLELGHIRDRVFMVISLKGKFITARSYPKMVLVTPRIAGSVLTVSAPGIEDFEIDIQKLHEMKSQKLQTWFKDILDVVDAGDDFAEWMSRCVLGENQGLRVVFYPSKNPKPKAVPRDRPFKAAGRVDQGAFADETSFMLLNQGSIDELNTKLEKKVSALRFRPNFLVNGPAAWEEDNWIWIKIGNETIFKKVQPCTRCVFTTIDPSNGVKSTDNQPLKQLEKTRTFKASGPAPAFGIQLGVRQKGKVKVGDKVYVG